MKKVLFINSNKVWGGGEKWHFEMAMALKSKGLDVHIITNTHSELADKAQSTGLECTRLEISNLSFLNPVTKNKVKSILKNFTDATLFMNLPSDVKLFAPIAKTLNQKTIYRRGMPHPIKNNFLNSRIYKNVDCFIANSKEIEKSIYLNLPELKPRIKLIFNGVSKEKHPAKELSYPINIGHMGRLVDQKGFELLLNIASLLNQKHFNFHLYIAGKGPDEQKLKQLAKLLGIMNITFLGHISADDFFSKIDLMAFCSKFEGSANTLIESLQYGVPSVCFNTSSMPEVIEDSYNGHLIAPFNTEAMSDKIIEMTNDPQSFKKLQDNCYRKLDQNFLFEDKVKEVMELLN